MDERGVDWESHPWCVWSDMVIIIQRVMLSIKPLRQSLGVFRTVYDGACTLAL